MARCASDSRHAGRQCGGSAGTLVERYIPRPHRVINSSGQERLSLVLAYDPNAETLVDSGLFATDEETSKYEPITCGDYLGGDSARRLNADRGDAKS